jgi:hypothetical protein
LRFCDFKGKAISVPPGTLAISGIPAILQFQPDSDSSSMRDPCDFRDSCDFAISTGKRFQFHQGSLRFQGIMRFAISARKRFQVIKGPLQFQGFLRFCDLNWKALSIAQGILAISGILAILQFQPLSNSVSPGFLAISGILAILQFQRVSNFNCTRDPCDFRDSCNFATSARRRYQLHKGPLQLQGFLQFCDFKGKAISVPPGTLATSRIPAILRFQPESDSSSIRDPCDFRDSCDFAISTGKQF